ncbi:hypothetical protein C8F01DRAFT_1172723 [Mycena amicta]|nr:hypothetical protein C8F01DRAFT_1172723 [Mycena amicta]
MSSLAAAVAETPAPSQTQKKKNEGSPDTIRSTKSVRLEGSSKGKRKAEETSERPSRQVSTSSSPPTANRQKLARASESQPRLSRPPSRISQAPSLPISALVTPHAPSIVSAGGTAYSYYHMRDPRKVPKVQPTGWNPSFGSSASVLFFLGFVVFPVWWVAGTCVSVPRTRRLDAEKGQVVLDDPQVEFDARTWRKRSRIMAVVSLFTYIPFIVLLAVFLTRT